MVADGWMLMDVDDVVLEMLNVAPELWSIKNVVCGIVCLLALAWTAPKLGPEDVEKSGGR